MNTDDHELAAYALDMWANNIETGEYGLSAADAVERKMRVKALGTDQMRLVIRLRDLAGKLRKQHSSAVMNKLNAIVGG